MRILSGSRRPISSLIVFALLFALVPPLVSPDVALGVPTTNAGTVTARLYCVVFPSTLSAGTGFAGGASGVILKTSNYGEEWTLVRSGGAYEIRSIGFFNASNGWAVTTKGETLRTSNGGDTWDASPETSALTGGQYSSPQIHEVAVLSVNSQPMMFAAGGAQGTPPAVWRGNYDTGSQRMYWADKADALLGWYDPPETQDPTIRDGLGYFYDIEARPSRYMWAVGQDVFKTPFKSVAWRYDANATGTKWARQTSIPGTGKLLGVSFATDTYGVTVGDAGMVSYTVNGGGTWTAGTSGESGTLAAVAAGSSGRAVAVGASGRIIRSTNSGATWTRMASPTARYLEDVAWIPGTERLVAVGDNGEVVYSLDGGVNWQRPATPPPPPAAPVMTSLSSASHPAGEWKNALPVSATWAATGTGTLTYHWVIDQIPGTVPTTANASTTSTFLPGGTNLPGSGTYYLHVMARDTYGGSSSPLHIQLLADVTAPTVVDDALPGGQDYTGSGVVTINASDSHSGVNRIEYRINTGAVQTVYAAQHAVNFDSIGDFTLEYRAFDVAGNAFPGPATWVSRSVSVVAPAGPVMTSLSSASHPAGEWKSALPVSATWAATGTGTLTYHWVIDQIPGTVPTTANASTTSTSLPGGTNLPGSGTYYLHVRAVDEFSQWSSPLHIQLLADVTKPSVADDVLAEYVGSATVKVTAADSHSGVQKIEYRIGGGAIQTHMGSQATIEFSTPSVYTLEYRAYDNAGNVQPAPGSWVSKQVTVKAPPAPVISSLISSSHLEGQWKSSTAVSASWTAAGATTLTYYWIIDQSAATVPTTANASTTTSSLSAIPVPGGGSGTYYLHVAARDTYGSWSLPWHQQILVDTVVPSTVDDLIGTSFSGAVDVVVTATDAHSGVERIEYRLNGGPIVPVTGDQTVITLYPGTTKLEHRARDAAGNESTWKFRNFSITTKQTPVQGDNRYATAIAASKQVYPGKMPAGPDGNRTVVIASGANWPDALGASGLAGAHRGPLLLTDPTTLPSAVAKQILDLGADRAIIVGGTGAVSTGVQASVASAVGGSSRVTRIPGANRYATSDAIGAKVVSVPGRDAWDGTAFVATGENFPDALAAAPLAAAKGYPLYLAPRTGISPSTVSAMKAAGVKQVVLLGGTSVVTATTQSRITGAGITVSGRWAGADRYSTARDVATKSLARGLTTRNVALATGQNFPDALAGGVMQGLTGSIMVLTTSDVLHAQAEALLGANAASVGEVRFIGGPAALSSAVRNKAMVVVGP